MRRILFAILLVAAPHGAFALTWDFDDGSTWGWTARESGHSNVTFINRDPLQNEVVDGVWRITPVPGRRPTVLLHSPLIGEDSALFDRLTLRLRIIHHSPTEDLFVMNWSNAEKRRLPASGTKRVFGTGGRHSYPLKWEDLTIDLRALAEADPEREITWQDTLFNFSLEMVLYRDSQDVDNHPKFLEIDWIQLTGAEELAQGELSPGDLGVELEPPGTLFAEPNFFPLGEGIGTPNYRRASQGAVGDVDGDGDADLVVLWDRIVDREIQLGWTVASNDGLGGFEPTQELTLLTTFDPSFMDLLGSDFDGDGLLDLVTAERGIVEVWYNRGDGFDPALQLFDAGVLGLADGDGDGDEDLIAIEYDDESYYVTLWINDGYDFVSSDRFPFDGEKLCLYLPDGQPLGEAASLLWNGSCYESQDFWQQTRPWAASQEPPRSFEAAVNPSALHLLADLDGNGMVDLLGSPESIERLFDTDYYGLALWRLDASGGMVRHSLLDWKAFIAHEATASDLNGDGVLDMAMVADNLTVGRPALLVWLGQRNGAPVFEGYYPLPGEGNQVLAGDVNGDGDTDLVVLGTNLASGLGGVFVLINQGTPTTAVAAEVATPTAFSLGANYPNPFNPTTTIPLAVPAGVKELGLNHLQCLGTADAPSVDGAAGGGRASS